MAPRLDRLRADMPEGSALLVSHLTNIRYLTGFTGSAGLLLVLPAMAVLVTDGRYGEQAEEQLGAARLPAEVRVCAGPGQTGVLGDLLSGAGVATLALEAAHVTWGRQRSLAQSLPGVELLPTEGLVERLRRIKDAAELHRLAAAAAIADAALEQVRDRLGAGMSESDFGRLLDFTMGELGAAGPSFETIVASGPNAAKPHHRPSGRLIGADEAVVIDFGALVDGYHSDMTRTVSAEGISDRHLRDVFRLVSESQAAGVAAVRAGVEAREVDRACRSVIEDAGYGDRFVHGTGHGVGLEIHEAPSVSSVSTDTLEAGQVVTVEPGVYLPGVGGVRIEDTVVVTESGCRPITHFPKEPS